MTSQATSAAASTDSRDLLVVGTVQLPDTTCQKKDSRQEQMYWQTHCRLPQFALRRTRISIWHAGPGVLGSYLGKIWLEDFPGATVVGQTNSETNHDRQAPSLMLWRSLMPVARGSEWRLAALR